MCPAACFAFYAKVKCALPRFQLPMVIPVPDKAAGMAAVAAQSIQGKVCCNFSVFFLRDPIEIS